MPVKITGLKCDFCNWRDDSIPYSKYAASIGKPCPSCGANLLTKEEFDKCEKIINRVQQIENIIHRLRWLNPFHYWRLVFGDKRKEKTITRDFPNRKGDV
jgi:hypothetical protein